MILYKALCGRIRIASRPIKSQRWYLRVLCDSIEPQRTLIESYRISSGSEAGSIRVRGTKQQGVAIGIRLYRGVRNKEKQGETRKNKEETRKTRKNKDPCFSLFFLVWPAPGAASRPCQGLCHSLPAIDRKAFCEARPVAVADPFPFGVGAGGDGAEPGRGGAEKERVHVGRQCMRSGAGSDPFKKDCVRSGIGAGSGRMSPGRGEIGSGIGSDRTGSIPEGDV
jgi:hypothetical protein